MFQNGKLTRFGWTVLETLIVFFTALLGAVFVEFRLPGKDHASFYAIIGSALALYVRSVQTQRQSEKNEDKIEQGNQILQEQNKDLAVIKTGVNGQTEAAFKAMREDTDKAMNYMREQFRVERHDLLGKLNHLELKNAECQVELKAALQRVADLEVQKHSLETLLRDCTSLKEATKGGPSADNASKEC